MTWAAREVAVEGRCLAPGIVAGFDGSTFMHLSPESRLPAHFKIELERAGRHRPLSFRKSAGAASCELIRLPPPSPQLEFRARGLALPGALAYAARHAPDILRFLRTGDPGLSVALRDAFGLNSEALMVPYITDGLFAETEGVTPSGDATILIPVFNAADDLRHLLDRLDEDADPNFPILLVDDASDDPGIAPMLQAFCRRAPDRRRVERLDTNVGFVGAVNHGLSCLHDSTGHVILLNTDTLPPNGWAQRLLAPILADPTIATVTPLSNAAEIASLPAQHVEGTVTRTLVDCIDCVARRIAPEFREVDLPTGIGFAMAMNRRFLNEIGPFDPAFGRGYGEEVDWCLKASAAGGRHVLQASLFIGHRGGGSFGAEKQARLAAAAHRISQRYPSFDQEVQTWALDTPHARQRLALTIPWLEATARDCVSVYLAHSLGGGAEMTLQREIAGELSNGAPGIVVLRAGGATAWRLEIIGRGFHHKGRIDSSSTLLRLLEPLTRRHIVYSCGVGARQPEIVPQLLLDLTQDTRNRLEVQFHDYFPISPSYCLLGTTGRYTGLPDVNDPAHSADLPLGEWQALWSRVLTRADAVVTFSQASADLVLQTYPHAADRVRIRPHRLDSLPDPLPPGGRNIGILGGINQAKGADVILSLARHMKGHTSRQLVILGALDPHYRLPRPHRVTGAYDRTAIAELARMHEIGLWLIPSVWPETFSFTTREVLATGLPVLTFDLGAQAEAARAAKNGHVLRSGPEDTTQILSQIEEMFARSQTETMSRPAP